MNGMNDNELLQELSRRFQDNKKALHDMRVMNEKIEKLNIKLAESERVKTNFLSNIRNEINNPLTSILGFAKQLTGSQADEKARELMAGLIYQEAFELDFQLRNVFMAAELEAGETAVNAATVDVASLVRSVISSFQHKTREKELEIDLACCGEQEEKAGLLFITDSEKVRLAVSNLLANAIEYSGAGMKVVVEARKENARLSLSITDQGPGISEQDVPRLFERFHQFEQGTTKRHKGHGLGLSVTKAVVEMLGGKVSVSRPPAGGSRFLISLPESAAPAGSVFSGDGNDFLFDTESRF